jgi:hypothetical protein
VAEDSLPRKAREVRRRREELARRREEFARRLEEIRVGHVDRLQEIYKKIEKIDAAVEADDQLVPARLVREVMDAMDAMEEQDPLADQLAELEAERAELEAESSAVLEEFEAVVAEASVEGSKLSSEALKHQATLAAGAIAGVAAITQVVMPQPLNSTLWLWFTYVVLLMTVWISVMLMHLEAWNVEDILRTGAVPSPPRWKRWANFGLHMASVSGLPVAFVLFLVFQAFNRP